MRATGRIGMLVFVSVMALAHAAPTTHAVTAEIEAALDKGDAQHAADLANAALKEKTGAAKRGRLLLYRGLAQELLGAPNEAMADFSRALASRALPPDEREQALLQRGFLRDGQGRLDEAVADYTAVLALKGESAATALNNRANVYRRQNRLADAKGDYQAALAMIGGKPQYSWYGLGQIAEAQKDMLAARGFYARAVAVEPEYSLASERLTSLGGPPEGAIVDTSVLILHPSKANRIAQSDVPHHSATQAATAEDEPIVLRAPSAAAAKAQGESVVLRPPRPRAAAVRAANPVLRPALDTPQGQVRGGAAVQLGAWRSEAEAQDGWAKARSRAGSALKGLSPDIVTADLPGKGRYYRLRVTPMASQGRGPFCAALMAQRVACLPVRD